MELFGTVGFARGGVTGEEDELAIDQEWPNSSGYLDLLAYPMNLSGQLIDGGGVSQQRCSLLGRDSASINDFSLGFNLVMTFL